MPFRGIPSLLLLPWWSLAKELQSVDFSRRASTTREAEIRPSSYSQTLTFRLEEKSSVRNAAEDNRQWTKLRRYRRLRGGYGLCYAHVLLLHFGPKLLSPKKGKITGVALVEIRILLKNGEKNETAHVQMSFNIPVGF